MGKRVQKMAQNEAETVWYHGGTAMQGRSHMQSGMPCQDQVQYLNRNGVSAIALADGAGSCNQSETGARVMVQRICEELTDSFDWYLEEKAEEKYTNSISSGNSHSANERSLDCIAFPGTTFIISAKRFPSGTLL